MDTNLIERLRELTIKRAAMEADDPGLMLVSTPEHTMICSEISSLNHRLAGEYAQAILEAREASSGDSHNSPR
jgi:hypothetical protein